MNRQEAIDSKRRMWSARLPSNLIESLQEEAKRSERSVSDLLIRILADRYHPNAVDLSSLNFLPQIDVGG